MENKAFIFDMDGVLVDSEKAWLEYESNFLNKLLGQEVANKVGDTIGMSVRSVYDKATYYGLQMSRQDFQDIYDQTAFRMYEKAKITPGIDQLGNLLLANNFRLGLVSSSARSWINKVLPRLSFGKQISCIVSLNERMDLNPKPSPDGYIEAIKELSSTPSKAIILEDSNSGIAAAKESGAFVIGFSQNLVPGYQQKGADIYAGNIEEVIAKLNL